MLVVVPLAKTVEVASSTKINTHVTVLVVILVKIVKMVSSLEI